MSTVYFTVLQLILILWSSTPRSPLASKAIHRRGQLHIMYLTDRPLSAKTETALAQFQNKLTNISGLSRTVQLTTPVLWKKSSTVLDTLRVLNRSVRWQETEIAILNLPNEKLKKMTLCGYGGLVFDVRTRPTDSPQVLQEIFDENTFYFDAYCTTGI